MLDAKMGPDAVTLGPAICVVINASPVVGIDIVEIVQGFDPGCRVTLFARLSDVADWLAAMCVGRERQHGGRTAVIDTPVAAFARDPLSGALERAGFRIIMTGADSQSAPTHGWECIEMPFDSAGLETVLARPRKPASPVHRHFI